MLLLAAVDVSERFCVGRDSPVRGFRWELWRAGGIEVALFALGLVKGCAAVCVEVGISFSALLLPLPMRCCAIVVEGAPLATVTGCLQLVLTWL